MGLFRKLKEKALSKIIAIAVRKLAEGDFGQGPAAAYWWLAGKKTYIAAGFAITAFALQTLSDAAICASCADYIGTLYTVSIGLAAVGLYDGALRTQAPIEQDR